MLQNKIPCSEISKGTKVVDIIEYTLKQKWRWAGHIARMEDTRWMVGKAKAVETKKDKETKKDAGKGKLELNLSTRCYAVAYRAAMVSYSVPSRHIGSAQW